MITRYRKLRGALSILALFNILLFVGCVYDNKENETDYEELQWQYLVLKYPDVQATCQAWQSISLKCYQQSFENDTALKSLFTDFGLTVNSASLYVRGSKDLTFLGAKTPPLVGLEDIYKVTVPHPEAGKTTCESTPLQCAYTSTEICSVAPQAEMFAKTGDKTNTPGAINCILQCSQEYMQRKYNADACKTTLTKGFYQVAADITSDAVNTQCVKDCMVRGTILFP